jgi:hypothetical protein
MPPTLLIEPQKEITPCNWVLGGGQRRSGLKSSEGSPESDRGRVGEWPRAY